MFQLLVVLFRGPSLEPHLVVHSNELGFLNFTAAVPAWDSRPRDDSLPHECLGSKAWNCISLAYSSFHKIGVPFEDTFLAVGGDPGDSSTIAKFEPFPVGNER